MKTLEQERPKVKASRGLNTVEDAVAAWYKPPALKSVLTEELAHQIAECYLDGCTDEETASLCDVAINTLKNWKDFDFIKKFERQRKNFYIHEIRDGKRRDWTRLAWWLERRYPLEFSRPEVAHAISTSIHTTVNATQNLIVSSELAEQLAERNASVASRIEQLFNNRPGVHNIKDVMCYTEELGASAREVKTIVDNITPATNVIASEELSPNVDQSLPNNPPFAHPGGGTPSAPPSFPTDTLSPTATQKTRVRKEKGFQVITDITGDSEKSAAEERKRFDKSTTEKNTAERQKRLKPLELEGHIVKVKTKSIMGENEKRESRATMIAELEARRKNTRVDRAALRAANKAADKIHPRKARK